MNNKNDHQTTRQQDNRPVVPWSRGQWSTRPLGYLWASLACFFAAAALCYPAPVIGLYALIFALGAVLQQHLVVRSPWSRGRFILSGWLLLKSAALLKLAARISPNAQTPKRPHAHTTILHPSSSGFGDDAEAPVTISQMLDILDRSPEAKVTIEIPRYRISAERISKYERFIETHAGREGIPAVCEPWFRDQKAETLK